MEFELRRWRKEDEESLAKAANNQKIADKLRNGFPHPYTLTDARDFIASVTENDESRQCIRAIEVNGRAVGAVGAFLKSDVYSKSAELGYWLAEPFWGKGIMTRAVMLFCSDLFDHYDIVRIFAEPFETNQASQKVLQKAGFRLEGILEKSVFKNGRLLNSCIYAKCR